MSRLHWDAQARIEVIEAAEFYDARRSGGGAEFRKSLEEALRLIRDRPQAGSPFEASTRRVLLDGYPYSVGYLDEPDGTWIFAVMHQRRKPGYWLDRLRFRRP